MPLSLLASWNGADHSLSDNMHRPGMAQGLALGRQVREAQAPSGSGFFSGKEIGCRLPVKSPGPVSASS